jgi:hypothetical protein
VMVADVYGTPTGRARSASWRATPTSASACASSRAGRTTAPRGHLRWLRPWTARRR